MEEEYAENHRGDQYVKRHAEFNHHRHAVGGGHRGEKQAVFQRHETHHLGYRLVAADQHQHPQQYHRHADRNRIAGDGMFQLLDRLCHVITENHQRGGDHQHQRRVLDGMGDPVDAHLFHQSMQQPGDEQRFQRQRQSRRNIQMVFTAVEGHQRGRHCHQRTLPGEGVNDRGNAGLRQQCK